MKSNILLLAFAVAIIFSSCSSAYKTGQTPDDVYFSKPLPAKEYVEVEKKDDRSYKGNEEYAYEDNYLRMRIQNRNRWSSLDDYYYSNPYAYNYYGSYYSWNNPYNNYWAWNNYYNPYCYGGGGIIIKNPGSYRQPVGRPIAFNVNSYNNNNNNRTSGRSFNNFNNNNPRYNNRNSVGTSARRVFSNSNSNYNSGNNNSTPSRSYNPPSNNSSSSSRSSSSSSSSSSSGSSGGGGVSRPNR